MAWQVGIYDPKTETWKFHGTYDGVEQATCSIVFDTGLIILATQEANGSYRVTSPDDNNFLACVREIIEQPNTEPGAEPEGRLGPLRRYRGLTWIGWLNFLVLRWFLFRLQYMVEEDNTISGYGLKFIPSWRW